jgi:hypothetical protein
MVFLSPRITIKITHQLRIFQKCGIDGFQNQLNPYQTGHHYHRDQS